MSLFDATKPKDNHHFGESFKKNDTPPWLFAIESDTLGSKLQRVNSSSPAILPRRGEKKGTEHYLTITANTTSLTYPASGFDLVITFGDVRQGRKGLKFCLVVLALKGH